MSEKTTVPPNEIKNDWQSNSKRRKTRGIIATELIQLFEVHDDLPVAAHFINIVRSKGVIVGRRTDGSPIYRDPYYIEDAVFLKELENYREYLDNKPIEDEE